MELIYKSEMYENNRMKEERNKSVLLETSYPQSVQYHLNEIVVS